MTHICTVATLCFPEKTFPRNYYYCVQDENSLCLCFKNMYRTLFVAIFTSTFIFSMYDHIGLPGCVFPYLSKYKYQQSSTAIINSRSWQRDPLLLIIAIFSSLFFPWLSWSKMLWRIEQDASLKSKERDNHLSAATINVRLTRGLYCKYKRQSDFESVVRPLWPEAHQTRKLI